MNSTIKAELDGLILGDVQVGGELALLPLLESGRRSIEYISLRKATKENAIQIKEISEAGMVPKLRLKSTAAVPVLIVDGEELIGAKQNRAVNTSILVPPGHEMTIPVSCTEQGRWRQTSPAFTDSDEILAAKARRGKIRSVARNLRESRNFASDQGTIWSDIADFERDANVISRTGAMKDVYVSRASDFAARVQSFHRVPGQRGFIFIARGKVSGLEFISRAEVYEDHHDKLLRSYVSDHLIRAAEATPIDSSDACGAAQRFIDALFDLPENEFPAVGLGTEYRLEDRSRCAAGLVEDGVCVHFVAFSEEAVSGARAHRMRSAARRRGETRNREN